MLNMIFYSIFIKAFLFLTILFIIFLIELLKGKTVYLEIFLGIFVDDPLRITSMRVKFILYAADYLYY